MSNKKSNSDNFIIKSKSLFNDKYDYSKVNYINNKTKVELICKEHGSFFIEPNRHLSKKSGCNKCGIIKRSKNQSNKNWLDKFLLKHGELYDYSKVEYENSRKKVEIICKEHGSFWQSPSSHYLQGCEKCGIDRRSKRRISENWFNKFLSKHGNLYDYSKVEYINNKTHIEIICKEHGSFWQTPYSHIRSNIGCTKCLNEDLNKRFRNNKWLETFTSKHGDVYDYSKVNYINSKEKIEIICKRHGSFWQTPYNHLNLQGCPTCKISKGERKIMKYLDNKSIEYKMSYVFSDCRDKNPLKYDFFIEKYNLCIEFDGIQHFKSFEWFGGDKSLEDRIRRDYIKDIFCLNNKISLLRISYLEYDYIDRIMDSIFNI